MPQSTRTVARSVVSRNWDPVTVLAAPRKWMSMRAYCHFGAESVGPVVAARTDGAVWRSAERFALCLRLQRVMTDRSFQLERNQPYAGSGPRIPNAFQIVSVARPGLQLDPAFGY